MMNNNSNFDDRFKKGKFFYPVVEEPWVSLVGISVSYFSPLKFPMIVVESEENVIATREFLSQWEGRLVEDMRNVCGRFYPSDLLYRFRQELVRSEDKKNIDRNIRNVFKSIVDDVYATLESTGQALDSETGAILVNCLNYVACLDDKNNSTCQTVINECHFLYRVDPTWSRIIFAISPDIKDNLNSRLEWYFDPASVFMNQSISFIKDTQGNWRTLLFRAMFDNNHNPLFCAYVAAYLLRDHCEQYNGIDDYIDFVKTVIYTIYKGNKDTASDLRVLHILKNVLNPYVEARVDEARVDDIFLVECSISKLDCALTLIYCLRRSDGTCFTRVISPSLDVEQVVPMEEFDRLKDLTQY